MNKMLLSLVAMMGLSVTTGCMAPVEAEEIDGEAAEVAEQVGEAESALFYTKNLSCSIEYPSLFQPAAKVTNPSSPTVGFDAEIKITVVHANSLPNVTLTEFLEGTLPANNSIFFPLNHTNALDALNCTAVAKWETP